MLPSSAVAHSEPLKLDISLVTPFSLNLTFDEKNDVKLVNTSKLLSAVMTLTSNMPLKSLRTELRDLAHIQQMRKINTYAGGAGLTLSTLSFIMILIISIIIICFFRVARERNQILEPNVNSHNNDHELVNRPRSTFNVAFDNIIRSNRGPSATIQRNIQTESLTSNIAETNTELTQPDNSPLLSDGNSFFPRSPVVTDNLHGPRVHMTDRHTCTLSDSHNLHHIELTHEPACPLTLPRTSLPVRLQ